MTTRTDTCRRRKVAAFIEDYAKETAAPVRANTAVTAVRRVDDGYVVETDQEAWRARTVVVAAGGATIPSVPDVRHGMPDGIEHRAPAGSTGDLPGYRNPADLPDGGVLVVGPSASGIQIAQEVHASGRPVTLAVGEHVRMPRTYRGHDVLWWMDATGLFDDRTTRPHLLRARVLPSMQLIGSPQRATLDLNTLSGAGVRLVGRLAGVRDGVAQLSGSLPNVCTLADLKLKRLLKGFDEWAAAAGAAATAGLPAGEPRRRPSSRPPRRSSICGAARSDRSSGPPASSPTSPSCPAWATSGCSTARAACGHDGGVVTASPGLYVIGLPFLRRRKSSLIDGAGPDAADIAAHLVGHLAAPA